MNIFVIYSANEHFPFHGNVLRRAHLSYTARGNTLMSEKLPREAGGGIMIVSMENANMHIAAPIYDEYRARGYSGIFLDADSPPDGDLIAVMRGAVFSLSRRAGNIFVPLPFAEFCPGAVPVASTEISGGVLSEYLQSLSREYKRLALGIPRTIARFEMPAENPSGERLTPSRLRSLLERFGSGVFFSPQMVVNYFTYSVSDDKCGFVLFDDSRTISEKLRLAKRLGVSDVFLTLREISDIAEDINL